MSNQLFPQVGVMSPTTALVPPGCQAILLSNTIDSTDYAKGDCVVLVSDGSAIGEQVLSEGELNFSDMTAQTVEAATVGSGVDQLRCVGVLLEDIDDGERGMVAIRGNCLMTLDLTGGTAMAGQADAAIIIGGGPSVLHGWNLKDAITASTVKIVAIAKNAALLALVDTPDLVPVTLNGIEGWGVTKG